MQVTYEFFSVSNTNALILNLQELNRHGKFNTVIRLYDKYELAYSSTKDTYTERTRSQYEFARDNISSTGAA